MELLEPRVLLSGSVIEQPPAFGLSSGQLISAPTVALPSGDAPAISAVPRASDGISPSPVDPVLSSSTALSPVPLTPTVTGTWTSLAHHIPSGDGAGTMELLSDGTVLVQGDSGTGGVSAAWHKLTPDSTGSYVNGTWTTAASMSTPRLYTAANMLTDGRLFILGGEYSGSSGAENDNNTGEIYDPVTNTWTGTADFPEQFFGDDPTAMLPDGKVLAGYILDSSIYIYDPTNNSWSPGPDKLSGDRSDEETWVTLPDHSILSYNVFSNLQHAQRYDPAQNAWINSGSVPVQLETPNQKELGPGFLLPDGRVFLIGATGHTALYTPSVTPTGTGSWAAGPDIPDGLGANDAPGAMMPNGHVLFAASETPGFGSPTNIFEYDPVGNTMTDVTPSGLGFDSDPSFIFRMLMLPTGQVLVGDASGQLYTYTPVGSPQDAWKPTITNIVDDGGGVFTLTGTQLNGISEGAGYGDDAEMSTNYPIIKLVDLGGTVRYARTFNWSNTGVATGNTPVTVQFTLPPGTPGGNQLSVIANGIESDSVGFPDPPTVSATYIDISGATGTGGAYRIGDTVTATWDNTVNGDNNARPIVSVSMDFSQFGGGVVAATNNSDIWTATYQIVSGSVDATNRNVIVTATNDDSGAAATTDDANVTVDNVPPTVTALKITISGATGTGGAYRVGDTVLASWDNTASGDNNADTMVDATFDFSQFGGGTVAASNNSNTWTASYLITDGAIDDINRNVAMTATDNAGNTKTTTDNANVKVDNIAPTVTAASITISGATGTGGAFRVGDTVNVAWNNTSGGDNNTDTISTVKVDFSQFGGGLVTATKNTNTWSASYKIVAGVIDATNHNVVVTASDNAGNPTATTDDANATVDNIKPTVTAANISISGGTGPSGAFRVGDTILATWDNTAGGDNNADTIVSASVTFTQFGGGIVTATNNAGLWTASYLIAAGAYDNSTRNVMVTAIDNAANSTATTDDANATIVNLAPTDIALSSSSVAENLISSSTVGTFSTTDPDAGNTFTYTLVSGTGGSDNASFTISSNTLKTSAPFNFETQGSYSIRVRSTDQGGLSTEKAFTITVTNVNEAPTSILLPGASVAENLPSGTTVATLATTDPDAGGSFTYTLVSGTGSTDNASFTISGSTLKTAAAFNFEAKNIYSIRIRSTDQGGLSTEKAFTVSVTDVNEAPLDVAITSSSVAENLSAGTAVGNFFTSDPDTGNTFTYSLVGGTGSTDNASFTLNGNALSAAASFNFEAKNSYSIRVRSTDQDGLFTEKALTISVTDINEAPTDIGLPSTSVAENQPAGTTVAALATTDPDANNTFTYSFVGGTGSTDNSSFTLSGSTLKTAAAFNFEAKSVYSIRVRSTDQGGLLTEKALTINVTDVNETPTNIVLAGGAVAENLPPGTTAGVLSTTDPDTADTFTYTLVNGQGGNNNNSFTLTGATLKTTASFDFEAQKSYSIRLRTTDSGGLFTEKILTVNVTNVNEPPTALLLGNGSIAENMPANTAFGSLSTVDPDEGDIFTDTLVSGPGSDDNGFFTLIGNQLRAAVSFDYETRASYSIRVRTTDSQGHSLEQPFTVNVTNVNEAPTDLLVSNSSVPENPPLGSKVLTFSTVDPDLGDAFNYTLLSGAGPINNPIFTIVGNELRANGPLNFEGTNTYTLHVRVSDIGGLTFEKTFTINATNVNEAPTDIFASTDSIPENMPAGTPMATFASADPDAGDGFSYALVSGAGDDDNAAFTVNSDNQIRTTAPLDFEAKNTYHVRIRSTDLGGLSVEKPFTFFVSDANEAPSIEPQTFLVPEHSAAGTVVGFIPVNDPDAGDTFTFSILNGNTGNAFAFDPVSGALVVNNPAAIDFKTKPSFNLNVQVADQGDLTAEATITVNLAGVFGTTAPSKSAILATTDVDGTTAKFTLTGGGSARVVPGENNGATFYDVFISGTTDKSVLTITATKSKLPGDDGLITLRNVTVEPPPSLLQAAASDGVQNLPPLGKFVANTSKLTGTLDLPVGIKEIDLAATAPGAIISIDPSAAGTPGTAVTLSLGVVQDLTLNSASPILSLTAINWLDADAVPDTITAPSIGSLTIKGSKKVGALFNGDFDADVLLTDATPTLTLGTVTVAGALNGATILSAGNIGNVTVGAMRNSILAAGFSTAPIGLPSAFNTAAAITSVKVKDVPGDGNGFVNSLILGASVGTISLKDVATSNAGVPFGIVTQSLTSYTRLSATGKVIKKLGLTNTAISDADNDSPDDLFVTIV